MSWATSSSTMHGRRPPDRPLTVKRHDQHRVRHRTGAGAGFNVTATSIEPANDGTTDIYVAGGFTNYNGTIGLNRMVRMNEDGTLDTSFTSFGFDSSIEDIAVSYDGSMIYAGGNFDNYNSVSAPKLVRLTASGARDSKFVVGSGFNAAVLDLEILPSSDGDQKVFCVGSLSNWKGQSSVSGALITGSGDLDPSFEIGAGYPGIGSAVLGVYE
jgi:hypothetical protein